MKLQRGEEFVAGASTKQEVNSVLWIRIPHEDAATVAAAVTSWIGGDNGGAAWKIRGKSSYLGVLVGGTGAELLS